MLKRIPAGIWTLLAVLLEIGLFHMIVARIHKFGWDAPTYWVFVVAAVALIAVSYGKQPALDAFLGGVAGLFFWAAFGEIGKAGEWKC